MPSFNVHLFLYSEDYVLSRLSLENQFQQKPNSLIKWDHSSLLRRKRQQLKADPQTDEQEKLVGLGQKTRKCTLFMDSA